MKHSRSVNYAGSVLLTMIMLTLGPSHVRYANAQSCSGACIQVGPRLVSLNSEEGFLIDAILGGLLGSSVDLDVLDWNAIAAGEINLIGFLDTLETDLGLSTTSEVLTANVTLEEFFLAAAKVAEADGHTALATALNNLAVEVSGLSGTINLGDLLTIDFPEGALADIELNALDLVSGLIQLYNYENVATTPSPVTIHGDSLSISGLDAVVDSITVYAQVVEPQVIVCDSAGATAHTAAIRIKLDVDLVSVALDFSPLVGVTASLGHLGFYLEVARGDALLTLVDAFTPQVDVSATPGVVDAYLGHIPDAVFWNRTLPSDSLEANLDTLTVGDVTFSAAAFESSGVITVKSSAQGISGSTPLTFAGPYPETQTAGTSATFIANLITDLVNNLEAAFIINGSPAQPVQNLIDDAILILEDVVNTELDPLLTTLLSDFVDPLLDALGIGIGEMDVTVLNVAIDPACQECDLQVAKVVDKTSVAVGDTVTFSIVLDNNGPDDATGVVVGDTLEAGFMFISSSASNGSYNDVTGEWTVGPVESGTSDTLMIMVKVNPSGPYSNVAQVSEANQPDPDSTPGNDDGDQSEDDENASATIDVSPLPVELVEFTGLQVGERTVELRWSTATETNNAGFEVQSQINATCEASCESESHWNSVAFVEGVGNATDLQTYSYRMDDVQVGRMRFRLKQVDFDGAFEYSPIVEVFVELPSAYEISAAYPNPFRSQTSIDLTVREAGQISVDVFDATGRKVARLYEGLVEPYERTRLELDGAELPAGVYLIRIDGARFSDVRKVLLVR